MTIKKSSKNISNSSKIQKVENEDKFIRNGKIYTLIKNIDTHNLDINKNYIISKPLNGKYNQSPIFAGKYNGVTPPGFFHGGEIATNYMFDNYNTYYTSINDGDENNDNNMIKVYEENNENVLNSMHKNKSLRKSLHSSPRKSHTGGKRRKTKKNSTRKNKK
jgi:hypothetical protein